MIERPSRTWQRTVAERSGSEASGWAAPPWPAEPVAAVDEALATYETDIAALVANGTVPSDETVLSAVRRAVTRLNEIDMTHGLIETVEREQLCEYLDEVPRAHGVDMTEMARRRGFDDGDVAGLWRDW